MVVSITLSNLYSGFFEGPTSSHTQLVTQWCLDSSGPYIDYMQRLCRVGDVSTNTKGVLRTFWPSISILVAFSMRVNKKTTHHSASEPRLRPAPQHLEGPGSKGLSGVVGERIHKLLRFWPFSCFSCLGVSSLHSHCCPMYTSSLPPHESLLNKRLWSDPQKGEPSHSLS